MTDILLIPSSQPFTLFQSMCHFKYTRTRNVIMAVFDAVEDISHFRAGPVELRVGRNEEGCQGVWGEVAEWAAVCVLCAGLICGEDGLAAACQSSAKWQKSSIIVQRET